MGTEQVTVGRDQLRRGLQQMDDYAFEHFVADLWARQGWDTEVEQQSTDAGVDVRATKQSPYQRKILIQAKRYSDTNRVGGPEVQQYAALHQQEDNVDEVLVVTTGGLTSAAHRRADDLNVKLIGGDDLVDLVDSLDALDIVNQYLDIRQPQAAPATGPSETASSDGTGISALEELVVVPLAMMLDLVELLSSASDNAAASAATATEQPQTEGDATDSGPPEHTQRAQPTGLDGPWQLTPGFVTLPLVLTTLLWIPVLVLSGSVAGALAVVAYAGPVIGIPTDWYWRSDSQTSRGAMLVFWMAAFVPFANMVSASCYGLWMLAVGLQARRNAASA